MIKLLFLDVDGVLNHALTFMQIGRTERYPLDDDCVARLQRIVKETGCRVVLSSTWRGDKEGVRVIEEGVVKLIGLTPHLDGPRGAEVNAWLLAHSHEKTPFAILDDDSDFYPWQPFFKTKFYSGGLTDEIADKVIAYLNSYGAGKEEDV